MKIRGGLFWFLLQFWLRFIVASDEESPKPPKAYQLPSSSVESPAQSASGGGSSSPIDAGGGPGIQGDSAILQALEDLLPGALKYSRQQSQPPIVQAVTALEGNSEGGVNVLGIPFGTIPGNPIQALPDQALFKPIAQQPVTEKDEFVYVPPKGWDYYGVDMKRKPSEDLVEDLTSYFIAAYENVKCGDNTLTKGKVNNIVGCKQRCIADTRCQYFAYWKDRKYCETYERCTMQIPDTQKSVITVYRRLNECEVTYKKYMSQIAAEFPGNAVRAEPPNQNLHCKCTTRSWMICGIFVKIGSPQMQIATSRLDIRNQTPKQLEPFVVMQSPSMQNTPICYVVPIPINTEIGIKALAAEMKIVTSYSCMDIRLCREGTPAHKDWKTPQGVDPINGEPFRSGDPVYILTSTIPALKRGEPVACISVGGLRAYSMGNDGTGFIDPFYREDKNLLVRRDYTMFFAFEESELATGVCKNIESKKKSRSKKKKGKSVILEGEFVSPEGPEAPLLPSDVQNYVYDDARFGSRPGTPRSGPSSSPPLAPKSLPVSPSVPRKGLPRSRSESDALPSLLDAPQNVQLQLEAVSPEEERSQRRARRKASKGVPSSFLPSDSEDTGMPSTSPTVHNLPISTDRSEAGPSQISTQDDDPQRAVEAILNIALTNGRGSVTRAEAERVGASNEVLSEFFGTREQLSIDEIMQSINSVLQSVREGWRTMGSRGRLRKQEDKEAASRAFKFSIVPPEKPGSPGSGGTGSGGSGGSAGPSPRPKMLGSSLAIGKKLLTRKQRRGQKGKTDEDSFPILPRSDSTPQFPPGLAPPSPGLASQRDAEIILPYKWTVSNLEMSEDASPTAPQLSEPQGRQRPPARKKAFVNDAIGPKEVTEHVIAPGASSSAQSLDEPAVDPGATSRLPPKKQYSAAQPESSSTAEDARESEHSEEFSWHSPSANSIDERPPPPPSAPLTADASTMTDPIRLRDLIDMDQEVLRGDRPGPDEQPNDDEDHVASPLQRFSSMAIYIPLIPFVTIIYFFTTRKTIHDQNIYIEFPT